MGARQYIVLRDVSAPRAAASGRDNVTAMAATAAAPAQGISVHEETLTEAESTSIRRDPRVLAIAEPMPLRLIRPVAVEAAPIAPAAAATWGVDAVGAPASPFDGSGITVAVLDTGIDPAHPAFAGVTLVRRNFTTGSDDDTDGHGTHCAGTIFGRDVSGQRIGVARGVSRAVIGKVLGPGGGSSATLLSAIQWALDQGAHVISMSLGIDFPGFVKLLVDVHGLPIEPATSIALEQYRANVNLFNAVADVLAARALFEQGAIVVAASGNESNRPAFEIAVAPPAAATGIIAIGALGESAAGLAVAPFSNTQVDVAAPGVGVVSAKRGGGLVAMSGTSMATPHAAGVAALWAQKLLAAGGAVEPEALTARLLASGTLTPLAPASAESDVGSGLVQAPLA
jgi:subtilisin family serine protease